MTEHELSFSGNLLYISGRSIVLEYPIADAFIGERGVIVLLNPDSFQEKTGQFLNLLCISREGERVWVAELPTNESGDRYYRIASKCPLVAYSVKSFECMIDPWSGKLVGKEFYK